MIQDDAHDTANPRQVIFDSMMRFLGMILLLGLSTQVLAGGHLYRYTNDQGVEVIDDSIPPEYVKKGYDVLTTSGRLLEHVPAAMTPEQLAAQKKKEALKQEQAKQLEADKKLLEMFSGPKDAERARDRKMEAIDVYINVTKGNINKLQGDYDQAQAQAAERERAGQKVPDYLVQKMDSISRQVKQAKESIQEKLQEKQQIRQDYQKDIDRLKVLVKMREEAEQQQ